MPTELNLLDLSNSDLENLLEKLDFVSIQCLRKSCHDLRNRIDDLKPDSSLTKIKIGIKPSVTSTHFWYGEDDLCIEYHKNEEGCAVVYYKMWKKEKKILKDVDFVEVACNDLKSILVNQESLLENLTIEFQQSQNEQERDLEITANSFFSHLDLRNFKMKVKTFQATVANQNQVTNVLRGLDPEFLVNLTINNTKGNSEHLEELEIGELVKMEQWKKAEVLNILNFLVELHLEDFVHFKVVNIAVKMLSMEDFTNVKEIFLFFSNLQYFKIRFEQSEAENNLIESFGQPMTTSDQLGQKRSHWYFKTSSVDEFLSIILYEFQIIFERNHISNLPNNALLL